MKRLSVCLLVVFTLLLSINVASAKPAEAPPAGVASHIIVFRNGVGADAAAESLSRAHGLGVENVFRNSIHGMAAMVPPGRLNALRNDPRVAYIEENQVWHIAAQETPTGITRSFASSNPTLRINGADDFRVNVDVAVLDSGIAAHSDLNLFRHVDCASGNPRRGSCKTGGTDGNGHGTHVAGTIGAIDNGNGVVGVAPGARLWGVRVLNNQGSGYTSWIIAGIDYVTANAASIEVVNMSLGCECSSAAQDQAMANSVASGVVYVVAAGNNDKNAATFSPANHPDVVTVSALSDFDGVAGGLGASTCRVDEDDTLANFSNFGATVEIAAPGVCILSTWMGGGYNTISGTSMASPHVAGAAAILASYMPTNNRADVFAIRSTLVSEGNFNWTDDSGDGIKEPLLDLSDSNVFAAR